MSDYLTVQEVIDYIPSSQEDVLYWDEALDAQNTDWIQEDIDCAESDIESYLGKYYQLPATIVDNPISFDMLKCITLDITIFRGYKRTACGMPEEIMFVYAEAIKKLKEFRDEKAYLPDLPSLEDNGVGKVELFSNEPTMQVSSTSLFY